MSARPSLARGCSAARSVPLIIPLTPVRRYSPQSLVLLCGGVVLGLSAAHSRIVRPRSLVARWAAVQDDLHSDRGVWGSDHPNPEEVIWMLDPTEGPFRMRKKVPRFLR